MIKLDQYDFENTAKAVYAMNPSVRELYDSWEDFLSYMEYMAYGMSADVTSMSTAGFQLTAFPLGDGRMVRASVSAYTAIKYVESMQKISDTLKEIVSQIDQGGSDGKVFARDNCIERARAYVG